MKHEANLVHIKCAALSSFFDAMCECLWYHTIILITRTAGSNFIVFRLLCLHKHIEQRDKNDSNSVALWFLV